MAIDSPRELLIRELQHIEDAESQASQALQRISQQVENSHLRRMLERRRKQGERLLKDVQRSLEKLDGHSRGNHNSAAHGIIQESDQLVSEAQTPEIKQAIMIAGVQKLEHYCIATWGPSRRSPVRWAKKTWRMPCSGRSKRAIATIAR